ncbi:YjbF family lipoprotein [Photobacterium sanctipauli]|uniref:YjbF family lipoprotein n=1 Tax=Photobacterium sanctipauli TaxID=1342794 RepID=UPI00308415AF
MCSVALLALTGCSQKFKDVNDTLSLAFFGDPDVELQSDEITNLPYASIYARVDDGPQAFMVLALAESKPSLSSNQSSQQNNTPEKLQLKWLSSDGGMLVTEHGRLVKTLNLPVGNLVNIASQQVDPLQAGLHLPNSPKTWQRIIDWQPGYHFGYTLTSTFDQQGTEIIMVNQQPVEAMHFKEAVYVEELDMSYNNQFWIEPTTGKVLKSQQKLAPGLPYIDITLLKPFS